MMENPTVNQITLALTNAERKAFSEAFIKARRRFPHALKSTIFRELTGLADPVLLNKAEIEAFRRAVRGKEK